MARIYQVEIQVIVDDNVDEKEVELLLNNALASTKIVDNVYIRECNFLGACEEDLSDVI